ncbi:Sas10/Utp3 family protein [Cordyceps fumosorosea ARSEF 2679]|uniref:Sas10/Utp3 family protein n=1 Tax=Cordyceps fumosorosea (strain ARSEF 2679) TaxID=1081104 RepID=A0A168CEK3_CORFA|nr:Sas10/Utp3 family protein [Cordyceps fumosorosea ARSEF 2679]OAA71283.1 Sas10/Utp3 family protein [Cordyceps fumosorosea ARSEF 2679]
MGKKRKASGRNAESSGPRDFDPADARLGPISTYEDVANSEDEHFLNQDTIMLDEEPGNKRRRQEDDMELSDEEILGYEDSDSEAELNDAAHPSAKNTKSGLRKKADDNEDDQEEEEDAGWWGSSRKEYYDADKIETEADAQEEEVEAKRIQKKKLAKMQEEDFIFDSHEWLAADGDAEDGGETVTEVLKEVEITDDMTPKDRHQLLVTRYPEFEYLVTELEALHPMLAKLKAAAKSASAQSLESVKYWVLGCYVATLASYFAILTAPARDAEKAQKTTDPSELREHEVMETLIQCRNAWTKIQSLQSIQIAADNDDESVHDVTASGEIVVEKPSKKKSATSKADAAKKKAELARAKEIEASVADLYNLPLSNGKPNRISRKVVAPVEDENSDFGEEDTLDVRTAAQKAARKKSLKFYTSQIVQKANRRAGAGRDAGGDEDIPHRERLRDRQARLLAAAEKRGKRDSKHGAALGEDSDEGDDVAAKAVRGEEDDYYDMVAHKAREKKEDKAARYAAYAAASKADRVVEMEQIGEDGKRKINYTIEKNKGLTPRRSKDVRNPRVKKRKQYEAKQKKLKSMKPVWQGGEPKGGYKGEQSGINVAVVKSTRL